ncbi:DNA sulfur modification protein DndD [Vibrio tritonius]|uniref:DNA sulfur modification protein DndD n=1 Tax=Vibrio tritonius TaxID=1435069 RepID=UPI0008397D00|nr:DNA sulfur modification protein DndD [Vibrio tritonius]
MIFEQVKLYNFGIYQGEHIINLDINSHTQPIVLLGGLNGGGKTTLLDSLQLALYGKHAKCSNRGRLSYSEYLKQVINRYSSEESASVSLTFRHSKGTLNKQYEIIRNWSVTGAKEISDNITVLVDGEKDYLLTENWNDFVSEFIPQSMSELFFFDGEKIEDLADPTRSAQLIKTGIEALLGLELLSQLSKDLNNQRQNKQGKNLNKTASEKFQELADKKEILEKNLETLEMSINDELTNQEDLQENFKVAESALHSSGAHLLDDLSDIQAEKKRIAIQVEALDHSLLKIASSALPLSLCKNLLFKAHKQAECEDQVSRVKEAQEQVTIQNKKLLSLLNKNIDNKGIINLVGGLMEQINQDSLSEYNDLDFYLNTKPDLFDFALITIQNEEIESNNLLTQKNDLVEKLALVNKKLEAVPDFESVKDKIETKDNIEVKLKENSLYIEALIEERNQCIKQIHENELRLEATLVQKNIETFEHKRNQQVADHLIEMRTIIDNFKEVLIKENISKLERKIKSKFDTLGRKSNLITEIKINPISFNLTIKGTDYKPIDPKRFSAGERQLLSVAILWALADESGKEIPTIIDTPMGRLDGKHRTKLVENYFPSAAGQVILLSTDEEISGSYYKKLKPYIAREYHISYQDELQTSTITPGYFGGEA